MKWVGFSDFDNRFGNTAGIALFPILIDEIGKLALWELGDQFRSSASTVLIHAHIERAFGEKAHPPLRTVQLSRRHAKIKDHAVNLRHADRHEMLLELAEISLNQAQPRNEPRQIPTRRSNCVPIAINAYQDSAGPAVLQDERRMAALSYSTIEINPARLPDQPSRQFPGKHWNMTCRSISF